MHRTPFAPAVFTLLLAASGTALAQDCPAGTEYELLYEDGNGDIHYRCADRVCEAELDRELASLRRECDALSERLLRLPAVEAHLETVTEEQLRRAQQDLIGDFVDMLQQLKRALMRAELEEVPRESVEADLAGMEDLLRRNVDFRQLQPYVSRLGQAVKALGLVSLAASTYATWQSLERLIQRETDAQMLAGLLETKRLNLQNQLSACSRKVEEARDARSRCSRAY